MQALGHRLLHIYYVFKRNCKAVSRVPTPLYVPTSSDAVSPHPRQHVVVVLVFILATLIAMQGCLFVA